MDVISKLFNINDSKTCIFGGTLIDVNTDSGYDENRMIPHKGTSGLNPKIGLCLYPLIKEVQNGFKSKSFPLSLMDTWLNGFIPNSRSLSSPDNICSDAANILDKLSLVKTSQVFKTNTSLLETLFYFFTFYRQQDRILNLDTFNDEDKETLISKGLVCDKWASNPLPIRYVIRREGKSGNPDYLYFIGGSDILIADDFSDIVTTLKTIYENNIYKKSTPKLFSEYTNIIWNSLSEDFFERNNIEISMRNSSLKLAEFIRILSGIICIRNYFYYAYHEMGIESVIDFNGNDIKKVSTKKILDNYEDIYQYCKTISLLWKNETNR
jgi:hypothetical protein